MHTESSLKSAESHFETQNVQKIDPRKTFKTFQLDITNKGLEILENDADLLFFARPETYSIEGEEESQEPSKAFLWFKDRKVTSASSIYKLLENEVIDIKTAGPCPKSIKESRLGKKAKKIQTEITCLLESLQEVNSECRGHVGKRIKIGWDNTDDGFLFKSIPDLSNNTENPTNPEPTISPNILSQLVNVIPSPEMYCIALHRLVERDMKIEGLKKQNQVIQTALDQLLMMSENPSVFPFEDFQPVLSDSKLVKKIQCFSHNLHKLHQELQNSKLSLEQARCDNEQLKLNKDTIEEKALTEMSQLEERNKELEEELKGYKNETKSLYSHFKTKSESIHQILVKEEQVQNSNDKGPKITSNNYLVDHQEGDWSYIRTFCSEILEIVNTLHERNINWKKNHDDIKTKFDQNKEKLVKIQKHLISSKQWNFRPEQIMEYLKRKAKLSKECNFSYDDDWSPNKPDHSKKKYTLVPFLCKKESWHLLIYCKNGDHHLFTSSQHISEAEANNIVLQRFQDFKGVVKKKYLPIYHCQDEPNKTRVGAAAILSIAYYAARILRNLEGVGFQKPNRKEVSEEITKECVEATTFKIFSASVSPLFQEVNEIETY